MKSVRLCFCLLSCIMSLTGAISASPAQAQSIVPADDGTGTLVNYDGNRIDIYGGTRSGANLFHSFEKLGLSQNQIATILSNPEVRNIFARVVGGNPSVIDGLLQVTGGNSNLYLMNPAGIIFGSNFSLNVPASFTATTANGIGFGNNWFNAFGANDYAALVGDPTAFAFAMSQPGIIVNRGNLTVAEGQNLALLAGSVVNTGSLSAPGGQITLAAVPGENLVRMSVPGSLLSVEIQPIESWESDVGSNGVNPLPFTPLSLPELLTGGDMGNATGLTVNPDGTISLTGSTIASSTQPSLRVTPGAIAVLETLEANSIFLIADEINLQGGVGSVRANSIGLKPATLDRDIFVGGSIEQCHDLDITRTDLNAIASPFIRIGDSDSRSNITLKSANPLTFHTSLSLQAGAGSIRVEQAVNLDGDISFLAPKIAIGADITAEGQINVDGPMTVFRSATLRSSEAIAATDTITGKRGASIALTALHDITTGDINADARIDLTSEMGAITTGDLNTAGRTSGSAIAVSAHDEITTRTINSGASWGGGGSVTLASQGRIKVTAINAQGGESGRGGTVSITTEQFFQASDTFTNRNGIEASISTAGGIGGDSVIIRHGGGTSDTPFDVGDATTNGTGGAITTGSDNSILPLQSFPYSYSQGSSPSTIQLISQAQAQSDIEVPGSEEPGTEAPTPQNSLIQDPGTGAPTPQNPLIQDPGTGAPTPQNPIAQESTPKTSNREQPSSVPLEVTLDPLEPLPVETPIKTLKDIQNELRQIEQATGVKPALIYVSFQPKGLTQTSWEQQIRLNPDSPILESQLTPIVLQIKPQETDQLEFQLELVMVTSQGVPIRKPLNVTPKEVREKAYKFRRELDSGNKVNRQAYKQQAKQLYQWLIAPLESALQTQQIDNLVFVMDEDMRSLPLAALYDGKHFVIEKYSVGLMPSMSLTDTQYIDIRDLQVLAMGASEFTGLPALPAVKEEIEVIKTIWASKVGNVWLNEDFTLENLKSQRHERPFGIVHLATHGSFNPDMPSKSYLQLWDYQLTFEKFRGLRFNKPPVELLVLSACQTTLGNGEAELGFAGFAHRVGVKSVLASLWTVDDSGTLELMTQFYRQLIEPDTIKAEALRQAQLAMLNHPQLSHPHYWSGFTIVGNPW